MTHIPGHVATSATTDDTSGPTPGSSALGLELFSTDGTFLGRLVQGRVPFGGGEAPLLLSIPATDTTGANIVSFNGGNFLVDAGGGKLFQLTINNAGGIVKSGTISTDALGGGTGGSAPAFRSTQAGLQAEQAFQAEQDRLTREFQAQQDKLALEATAEENRLAEEGALKRGRLSTLTDLIQSFVASQAQARDTLANLQPDPFKFAAVAGGIAPFGVTPQQGFQQQLTEFASAAPPVADPNASLPSIESAIQGLTGAQVPLSPQVFGAAGGATIPAPPPGQSIAVKVGEKGEEILRITAQGVEVIPITAGAQEGGFFPFEPIEFDKESLFPALGTSGIFGSLGIPFIPRGRPGLAGGLGAGQRGVPFSQRGVGILEKMGIRPGLIRFGDETSVFFRNPEGQLERFRDTGAFQNAGFDRSQVVRFNPAAKEGFDFAAPFRGRPATPTEQPSAFTPFSQPIVEPTTGTLLPAPFMVAEQLNRLRLTNPTLFNLLLSAYEAANVPAQAVLGSIQSSLSFGQERGSIGLR